MDNRKTKQKKQTQQTQQKSPSSLLIPAFTKIDNMKIMSVAARGTTIRVTDEICVDAGVLPLDIGKTVEILMLTHGHSDHMKDAMNAFHDDNGKILHVFCPASIATNFFTCVKNTYSMFKGRQYTTEEILKHLRIYAVVCSDAISANTLNLIDVDENENIIKTQIATSVQLNDIVDVEISNKTKYGIRPFFCHHTVETVGYGIYKISSDNLNSKIIIPSGTVVEITPPKMTKDEKNDKKQQKKICGSGDLNVNRESLNFNSVHEFCKLNNIPEDTIKTSLVSRDVVNRNNKSFTLNSIRRIEFVNDVVLDAIDDNGDCSLHHSAFVFFNEYKIDINGNNILNVYHKKYHPHVMVFGDTDVSVFNQKYVCDILNEFPTIIIEATFLDDHQTLSSSTKKLHDQNDNAKKIKNLYDPKWKQKKHIFLPELIPIFSQHQTKKFILIHFSNRYTNETIKNKIDEVRKINKNIYAAI